MLGISDQVGTYSPTDSRSEKSTSQSISFDSRGIGHAIRLLESFLDIGYYGLQSAVDYIRIGLVAMVFSQRLMSFPGGREEYGYPCRFHIDG